MREGFRDVLIVLGVLFSGIQAYEGRSNLPSHPLAGPIVVAILFIIAGLLNVAPRMLPLFVRHAKGGNLDAFRNPNWKTVIRRDFKNESVDLDGKRFWDCTFNSVTLAFHGTGPVEFMGACNFAPNMILSTDCPAAMEYAKLIEIFSSIPNTRALHVGVDKDGKPLPRTFQIKQVTRASPESHQEKKDDN